MVWTENASGRVQKLIKRQKGPHASPTSPNGSLTTLQPGEAVNMPSSLFRSKSVGASKGWGLGSASYGSSNETFRTSSSSSSLWPAGWRQVLRKPSRRFSSRATVGRSDDTNQRFSTSSIDLELSWDLLPDIPHVSPIEVEFDDAESTVCVADDARQELTGQSDTASRDILSPSSSSSDVPATRPRTQRRRPKFTLHLDDELEFETLDSDKDRVGRLQEVQGSLISPPSFHFHLPSRLNTNIPSPQVFFPPPMSSASANAEPPGSPTSTIRPSLTRRPAGFGPQPGTSRRYTFAMAMTDEGITDEALVRELERIRAVRTLSSASPSRAGSQTNLPNLLTTQIPENEDIGDVWDLDGGQSDVDVTFDSGIPEQMLCESPSSERGHQWTQDLANALPAPPALSPPRSSSIPRSESSVLESAHRSSSSKEPAATWHTTRHALLTCRELVRTERHYLSSLLSLLSCQTSSQPPPLMLHYAAVLVQASASLVEKMEKSPTPSGVSRAFAAMESDLEAAYIGWCGVVGSWFVDGDQSKGLLIPEKATGERSRSSLRRLSKVRATILDEPSSRKPVSSWKGGFEAAVLNPTVTATRSKSTVSTASASSNASSSSHSHSSSSSSSHSTAATSPSSSVSGCSGGTSASTISVTHSPNASKSSVVPAATANPPQRPSLLRKGQAASAPPSRVPSFVGTFDLEELTRLYSMPALSDKASSSKPPRKPSVRDLAILPTQRIMRYVLLFKDLESNTPYSSSSRFSVERAAGVADRLAKKCDRAQNNAAFIVSPPPVLIPNPVENIALPMPATPVVSSTIPRTTPTVRLVEPHSNSTASFPMLSKTLPVLPETDLTQPKEKGKEKERPRTLPRKLTKRSRAPLSLHTRRKSELGYDIQEDIDAVFSPSDTVSIYTSSEHGHGVMPASASHAIPLPSVSQLPSTHPLDVMSDDENSRRWRSQSHTNLCSTQRIRTSRRMSINWTSAFSWLGSDKGPAPPSAYSSVDLVSPAAAASTK